MRDFKHEKKPSQNQSSSDPFFRPQIQPKLAVGKPGDKFEAEADTMADKVVNQKGGTDVQRKAIIGGEEPVQQQSLADGITSVQRKEAEEEPVQQKAEEKEEPAVQKKEEEEPVQKKEEEEQPVQKKEEEEQAVQKKEEEEPVQKKEGEEPVQQKEEEEQPIQKKEEEKEQVQQKEEEEVQKKPAAAAVSSASPSVEKRLRSSKGKGTSLDSGIRSEMERGFGADFSGVNIHTDAEAVRLSDDMGAQAFTTGNDIYFNEGKYDPSSKAGKTLLAHELTHTIQQGAAGTSEKDSKGHAQQRHAHTESVQRKEEPETVAEKEGKQSRQQPLPMQGQALTSFNNREITISSETGFAYILSNQTPGIDLNITANFTNGNFNSNTYTVSLLDVNVGRVIARRPVRPRRRRGQPIPGFPIGSAQSPITTSISFSASEAPIDNFRIVISLDNFQPERNVHFSVTGS